MPALAEPGQVRAQLRQAAAQRTHVCSDRPGLCWLRSSRRSLPAAVLGGRMRLDPSAAHVEGRQQASKCEVVAGMQAVQACDHARRAGLAREDSALTSRFVLCPHGML